MPAYIKANFKSKKYDLAKDPKTKGKYRRKHVIKNKSVYSTDQHCKSWKEIFCNFLKVFWRQQNLEGYEFGSTTNSRAQTNYFFFQWELRRQKCPWKFSSTFNTDVASVWRTCGAVNRLQDDGGMAHIAFTQWYSIHSHFTDAMEMNKCSNDDENVKYLMWLTLKMFFA